MNIKFTDLEQKAIDLEAICFTLKDQLKLAATLLSHARMQLSVIDNSGSKVACEEIAKFLETV